MTVNHLIYRDIRYHPLRDLLPVASITVSPFILATGTANPRTRGLRSLADLVALAQRQPSQLSYGSGGIGNLQHLNMEVLAGSARHPHAARPYRGAAPAETALVAGEVDLMLETPTAGAAISLQLAYSSRHNWGGALARSAGGSDRGRLGYPDFVLPPSGIGLVAPAGTPPVMSSYAPADATGI